MECDVWYAAPKATEYHKLATESLTRKVCLPLTFKCNLKLQIEFRNCVSVTTHGAVPAYFCVAFCLECVPRGVVRLELQRHLHPPCVYSRAQT